jgi:type I restriction enzyme S subunit
MKKGWETMKLGEVLEKTETVNPLLSPNEEFDYIDVSSVSNTTFEIEETQRLKGKDAPSRARKRVRTNDIIFATIRPTLQRIAVVPEHLDKQVCSTGYFVLRPKPGVDHRFVYYSLFTEDFTGQMESLQKGASYPAVTDGDVRAQEIPVPPLAEQQRIVGLLDEAFEGLATAKANAEKNLQNARALFESHLQSVFTQRGPGWVDTALGGVCGFVRGPFGGSLKKSIFVADGYAVYEQQHAIYDQFDDVRYFIDEAKFKEMKRFELLPDDLIMSCSGTMGRVAIVPKDIKRGIINQALLKLTPSSKILNTFLKSWMESEAFQDALKEYSGGAAIQNVASVKILKEIKVPLPSMSDQKRVVEDLDDLHEQTQRLARLYSRKLAALEALKKSLLHQAFSGAL